MATKQDLRMDGNSRYQYTIQVTGVSLSGLSAKMEVKTSRGGTLLVDFSSYLTVDQINGLVIIDVPASANKGKTWTEGVYDIYVYNAGNSNISPVRILQGTFYLDREVTD